MRAHSLAILGPGLAGCAGGQPSDQARPAESAAATPVSEASTPMPTATGTVVYACPDGFRFSVRLRRDSAVVSLPKESLTLPHVPSGSGAKYAAGDAVFWSKGQEASLKTSTADHTGCRGQPAATPEDEARLLGVEFRGVGQEPGWTLELDQGRSLRFIGDYGSTRIVAPAPEPVRDTALGTVTYAAKADGHDLATVIREAPCRDVMSGAEFSHTVTVTLDGRDLPGCGRILTTADMTNMYWKLVELDGQPAIAGAQPEPHLRVAVDGSSVLGSTGCNSFRGRLELARERVKFGPLATTLMACLDPQLGSQEQRLLRALEAANRAAVSGDSLTLYAKDRPVARFTAVYLR